MARDEDFGERFGKLRKELNLSQADIARLMGMSQKSVSNFESGSFTPRSSARRRYENLYEALRQVVLDSSEERERQSNSAQPSPRASQPVPATGIGASPDWEETEWFRTRIAVLHKARKSGERFDLSGRWETENETWHLSRLRGEISRMAEHLKERPSKPSPQVRAEFSRLARYVETSQQQDSDRKHETNLPTSDLKFESLQDLIISANRKILSQAATETFESPYSVTPVEAEKRESPVEIKSGRLQDILGQTFRDISGAKSDFDSFAAGSADESLLNELNKQLGHLLPKGYWTIDHSGSFSQYSLVFDENPTPKLDQAVFTRECERLQIGSAYRRPLRIVTNDVNEDRVTIEFPHSVPNAVSLRELVPNGRVSDSDYALPLTLGLGARGVWGEVVVADLVEMPNLLVVGSENESTANAVVALTASLLATSTPQDLNLITIGTKESRFWSALRGLPHLKLSSPADDREVVNVLKLVTHEIDQRRKLFEQFGVGTINAYNSFDLRKHTMRRPSVGEDLQTETYQSRQKLPYVVVVIDESTERFSRLTSEPISGEVARIARLGHLAGIHLIIAASPSTFAELSDAIKSNMPARAVLRVDTPSLSRALLGDAGAELLTDGKDLLYFSPAVPKVKRLQSADVSVNDLLRIRDYWLEQQLPATKANSHWINC